MEDSAFSKVLGFLKDFDYFGAVIPFRTNGQRSYKSIISGVVFFVYMLSMIGYCGFNFANYVSFSDFKYIYSQTKASDPPRCSFNSSNTGIAYQITKNGHFTTELDKYTITSGFSISAIRNTSMINTAVSTVDNSITCGEIPCKTRKSLSISTKCTPDLFYVATNELRRSPDFKTDNFSKITEDEFHSFGVDKWYCLNMTELDLRGEFNSLIFNYYTLDISLKNNLTESDVNELKQLLSLNEFRLELMYIDSNFNITQRMQYITDFIGTDFLNIDYSLSKMKNFYWETTNLETDSNPISQGTDEKNYTIITLGPKEEYFRFRGENRYQFNRSSSSDSPFLLSKVYFRSSPNYRKVKLVYYKFMEFIADTTSIAQILLFVLMFFCSSINEMLSFRMMLKKIFKYQNELEFKSQDDICFFKELLSEGKKNKLIKKDSLVILSGGKESSSLKEDSKSIHLVKVENRLNASNFDNCKSYSSIKDIEDKQEEINVLDLKENSAKESDQENLPTKNLKQTNKSELKESIEDLKPEISEKKVENRESKLVEESNEESSYSLSNCEIVAKVFFNFFCMFCKNCKVFKVGDSEKYNIYKKGKRELLYYMDFVSYIKKMQEIDILKFLLLDDDQRTIMNFISKPSLDPNRLNIYSKIERKDNEAMASLDYEKIYSSSKVLLSKKDLLANRRLIQLLDYEIDYLAEKKGITA